MDQVFGTVETPRGVVTIRQAQEADAEALRELRLQALQQQPEAFGSDYARSAALPTSYWLERLREDTAQETGVTVLADGGQALAGMAGLSRGSGPKRRHSGLIWGVFVQPDWRGRRVGDALVQACLAWAATHDVRIVKLGVVTTNQSAIRCYERCGFSGYGVEPKSIYYDGVDYDQLLMARAV